MERLRADRLFLRLLLPVVVLGGTYAGLAAIVTRHVPANTTIDGIAIGGMSPTGATATLRRALASRASPPVRLQAPSATVDMDPRTAGLELDPEATLSDLSGFTLNPAKLWLHLLGGHEEGLRTRIDRAKLAAAVAAAAPVIDAPVKEGSITFTGGRATLVLSEPGRAVKVPETTDAVASVWPRQRVVPAVMKIVPPKLSVDEINRAAEEFAVPAMSNPVKVAAGGTTFVLQPAQYAPALALAPDGAGRLEPRIDTARLLAAVRVAKPGIERTPSDATVRLAAGRPSVVPAVIGTRFDEAAAGPRFLAALTSRTRTATIPLVPVAPKVSTRVAQGWGVKEKISTYTTHFPVNPPRTNNIKIAVRTLDGTLVPPGGRFSLNAVLGPRTPAKGYQKAPVIYSGRLEQDYGGGVSQVSTTTFNAAFFSGVKIEKHTPHSFYISRYPEGREATLSWPDVDQLWTNDTGFGILVDAFVSGSDLTVSFYGTKTWDIEAVKGPRRNTVQPKTILDGRSGCVPQAPNVGFDVTVMRIFRKNGVQVKSSSFNTHYLPEDSVSCSSPVAR